MMRFLLELEPIQWAVVPSSSVMLLGVKLFFLHNMAYAESVGGKMVLCFEL